MKVCEIMSSKVVCIRQDEPVSAAAKLLKRSNVGALPVCDDARRLRGIVTDRDIVTRCVALDADPAETRVAEIMSRGVLTASPLDEVSHAAHIMRTDQVRRLPVLDEGKLIVMVSLCDIARDGKYDMEAAEALADISANLRRS